MRFAPLAFCLILSLAQAADDDGKNLFPRSSGSYGWELSEGKEYAGAKGILAGLTTRLDSDAHTVLARYAGPRPLDVTERGATNVLRAPNGDRVVEEMGAERHTNTGAPRQRLSVPMRSGTFSMSRWPNV
jgi:hypothetical protein